MDGLYESYFIGGEWDGIKKRTNGDYTIKIIKAQTIQNKHKVFCSDVVDYVNIEYDVYTKVNHFPDGVIIYRLEKDLDKLKENRINNVN